MGMICSKKQVEVEEEPEEVPSPTKSYNSIEERITEIKEFLTLKGDDAEQIIAGPGCQHLSITDFQIKQYLAKGGYGKVYTAAHRETGKIYAMKIINKSQLAEQNTKLQTISQRLILQNLDHPFLVKLHFAFRSASKIYMLVDYVERGELFYIMRNKGKFNQDEARFFAAEILLALEYLHNKNIMYRDLKPENVLLGIDGHVKITDFGISKVFAKNLDIKTFSMCGTPEYIAPEVLKQKGYTFSSDWFSFGALVFDMITGKPPFYSKNQIQIVEKKLEKSSVPLPKKISAEARSLLNGLLKINPEERLGANGSQQIKNHPFFSSIDFEAVFSKKINPPPSISNFIDNITIDCIAENKSSSIQSSLLAKTFRSKLSRELRFAGFEYNKHKNNRSELQGQSIDEEDEYRQQY